MDTHYSEGTINRLRLRNVASGVQFEMEGDWVRASRVLKNLPADLKKAIFAGQQIFAREYKNNLIEAIYSSGQNLKPRWAPLSPKYLKYKKKDRRAKYKDTIGMYRGFMAAGIKIYTKGNGVVSIGISRNSRIMGVGAGNELTLAQYVNIFEHGSLTRNIKPRPLFGPVYRGMGGNRKVTEVVVLSIGTTLMAKYNIKI